MDTQFWLEKWESREIGFHRDAVNPQLERHWPSLAIDAERAVLVPLCGKSLDLVYLRRLGHPIVGVELSPLAVQEFFAEQGLQPESRDLGNGLRAFEAEGICLIQGDFFALRREDLPEIGAVYDRAALIAMPPEMQPRYAEQALSLLSAQATMLLITLEYDNGEMQGPPFSTSAEQVRRLYGGRCEIKVIESADALADNPGLRSRGVTALTETVWRVSVLL